MWINTHQIYQEDFEFTEEEIASIKDIFIQADKIFRLEFDHYSIDWLKEKMIRFDGNTTLLLLCKAMIVMKENGAQTIDELDKLYNKEKTNQLNEVEDTIESFKDSINVNLSEKPIDVVKRFVEQEVQKKIDDVQEIMSFIQK